MKSFDDISYTYNANGIRTSKIVGGVKHTYKLEGARIVQEDWGSSQIVPLYDNEDSICGILYNQVPYYFRKNLQGDIIAITDKYGETVARYTYDAWGKCTIVDLARAHEIATINPFRYRGYYYDSETALYYLQSRYYDPTLGRFVNADDVRFLGSTPIYANIFAYCANNLPNTIDSGGYFMSFVMHFKNDWAGREILKNYLFGGGKTREYSSLAWGTYMMNSMLCYIKCRHTSYPKKKLGKYIADFVYSKRYSFKMNKVGKTATREYHLSVALFNGEGIIGYNYLHGVNTDVGGLHLKITAKKKLFWTEFTVKCTWNDKMDPADYGTDDKKAKLAKKIPFANPTDYIIRIKWTQYVTIGGM
uniref:RHS repeat domain-containing protein n=1 Tax=Acetatifactor sp. TaxID=1872090 RepID=UPI0040570159